MLSEKDIKLIESRGLTVEDINKQIDRFKKGFPALNIIKPAVPNDGIRVLENRRLSKFERIYNGTVKKKKVSKFVPASGAASRMFKMPFEFMNWYDGSPEAYKKFLADKSFYSPYYLLQHFDSIPFAEDLKLMLLNFDDNFDSLMKKKQYHKILRVLLTEEGLGYGNLPKGLLKFHNYRIYARTAVEEHLVEGAMHATNRDGDVPIHFTISPEFMDEFFCHIEEVKKTYEPVYKVKYATSYSVQKPSTDTIAVDGNNEPVRQANGELLFRPGGHGALIENLNVIDSDLIFIKNIDNVVPDRIKPINVQYKKALGGILLYYQKKIFKNILKIENGKMSRWRRRRIIDLLENDLCFKMPTGFDSWDREQQRIYLWKILNRPIRVCGMVKNVGEPGGGPFWLKNPDGSVSLQIIEKAQIDETDPHQKEMLAQSTHFNPVDIVCSVTDVRGQKYNLLDFRDNDSGIIASKSKDGKTLKALELPGLWNGAMANWNTIFVEVPLITFNPVKEMSDLLRDEHQQETEHRQLHIFDETV